MTSEDNRIRAKTDFDQKFRLRLLELAGNFMAIVSALIAYLSFPRGKLTWAAHPSGEGFLKILGCAATCVTAPSAYWIACNFVELQNG